MMRCGVQASAVLGPGLADPEQAKAVLAGRRPWEHADIGRVIATGLPPTEARRATAATHLALVVADRAMQGQALPDDTMPSVWTAADSDLPGLERNCRTLAAAEPWISPHRFQNSVHNTPSGYWSIASGCHGPATALCSGDESFAAGLIEALTLLASGEKRCLLVSYDEVSPHILEPVRPVPFSFATALLLHADPAAGMSLAVEARADDAVATGCKDAGLERLRISNPSARALPLLCTLASGAASTIELVWSGHRLELHVGET